MSLALFGRMPAGRRTRISIVVLLAVPACTGQVMGPMNDASVSSVVDAARADGPASGFDLEPSNVIVAPSCGDNVTNETETDVDCGGACPKCVDGKSCAADADCSSGYCDGSMKCAAPPLPPLSCGDNLKNQDETDIDCGGSCPKCVDGRSCIAAADCQSGYCSTTCQTNPYTPDGCFKWAGTSAGGMALQTAIDQHTCVEVQAGSFVIDAQIIVKPGHTLRGVGKTTSILKANAAVWQFGCCDAMIADSLPATPEVNPFKLQKIGLDGSGVATYNVCCRGVTVEDTVLENSRCSAVGAVGKGVVVRRSEMKRSGQPTAIAGRGTISCATGGTGGEAEGAAIYTDGSGANYQTVIEDNVITGSYGPALDVFGAWGGIFRRNIVSGNTAWAAVSLYGASNWLIENNQIDHPSNQPPQPYQAYCQAGPAGGHSAGIFLCQNTDNNGLTTNGNTIRGNRSASYYGILSIGADEVHPYWAPRNNSFVNNDVFGSNFGCADDFKPGQWGADGNGWSGNNCAGTANSAPTFF